MRLSSQADMRKLKSLGFCYLCEKSFSEGEESNVDHVPPTSVFLVGDRDFPLILPTHNTCNGDRSSEDQLIGQLVGLLNDRAPNGVHNKMQMKVANVGDGSPALLLFENSLKDLLWRWVRGFHAALYEEALPNISKHHICPPLPEWNPAHGGVGDVQIGDYKIVEQLKRNRATGATDSIECRNGKCLYECVWATADDGSQVCMFGLQIYDWENLGDIGRFEPRGCIGMYQRPDKGRPPGSTCATELVFKVGNLNPLLPFGA